MWGERKGEKEEGKHCGLLNRRMVCRRVSLGRNEGECLERVYHLRLQDLCSSSLVTSFRERGEEGNKERRRGWREYHRHLQDLRILRHHCWPLPDNCRSRVPRVARCVRSVVVPRASLSRRFSLFSTTREYALGIGEKLVTLLPTSHFPLSFFLSLLIPEALLSDCASVFL